MKSEEIKQLFVQFEAAAAELEGVECWSARELQVLLGYSKWENFEKVIQKAKEDTAFGDRIVRKSSSGSAGFARGTSRRIFLTHLPFTPSVDKTDADRQDCVVRVGGTAQDRPTRASRLSVSERPSAARALVIVPLHESHERGRLRQRHDGFARQRCPMGPHDMTLAPRANNGSGRLPYGPCCWYHEMSNGVCLAPA